MKTLILGGTTFFGKEIVRAFQQNGHAVTIFTRGNKESSDLSPHQHVKGDRKNKADLQRLAAAGPWDIIVDNIAYSGEDVRLALEAFAGRAGRYLLTSTVSVYRYVRNPYPQPLVEGAVDHAYEPRAEDSTNVHWDYARGKRDAERNLIEQNKIPWTLFRPSVVYGPWDPLDRGFWYLYRMQKGGPLLLANGGAGSFRLAYSADVAKAYLLAAQTPKSIGRIYNIAQKEIITLRDFVYESAKTLEVKPEILSVPLDLIENVAGPYGNLINLIPDISAVQTDLGYEPTPWHEFAAITARWFQQHWRGSAEKLLETRESELSLAAKWRSLSEQMIK